MKQRNMAVPAVYLLIEVEERILIMRRQNTGYQDGNYNLPSGHIEAGELPKEAMVREAEEEIGIKINLDDLELVHTSYRPKHDETGDRVDFFFRAKAWTGQIINAELEKCSGLYWVIPEHLPKNTTPHVAHALVCIQKGISYSELGIDFLKKHGVYKL